MRRIASNMKISRLLNHTFLFPSEVLDEKSMCRERRELIKLEKLEKFRAELKAGTIRGRSHSSDKSASKYL